MHIRRVAAVAVLALVLTACGPSPEGGTSAPAFVGFGGGPPGGSAFPAAGAVATFVQSQVPGVNISVEGTGGSGENIRLVGNGDTDMGVVFGSDLHAGYFGTEDFTGAALPELRAIGLLFWAYGHLVTLADSGIQSVADLEGRRFAIGGTGTGTALTGERYFGRLDVLDRMDVSYLGGSAASTALKDGQVDAYLWVSGVPNSAVLDTVATHDVVLVNLADRATESGFLEAFPYYTMGEIAAGSYDGVLESVPTIRIGNYWIAHRDLDDDLVYEMVRAAYSPEGTAAARQTFAPLRDMTPEQALQGLTVPLHPGARRYWEERGLEIGDALQGP